MSKLRDYADVYSSMKNLSAVWIIFCFSCMCRNRVKPKSKYSLYEPKEVEIEYIFEYVNDSMIIDTTCTK